MAERPSLPQTEPRQQGAVKATQLLGTAIGMRSLARLDRTLAGAAPIYPGDVWDDLEPGKIQTSRAQRNPRLVVELSGVLDVRAATR